MKETFGILEGRGVYFVANILQTSIITRPVSRMVSPPFLES